MSIIERIKPYMKWGSAHLRVSPRPAPDQVRFLKLYGEQVLPQAAPTRSTKRGCPLCRVSTPSWPSADLFGGSAGPSYLMMADGPSITLTNGLPGRRSPFSGNHERAPGNLRDPRAADGAGGGRISQR